MQLLFPFSIILLLLCFLFFARLPSAFLFAMSENPIGHKCKKGLPVLLPTSVYVYICCCYAMAMALAMAMSMMMVTMRMAEWETLYVDVGIICASLTCTVLYRVLYVPYIHFSSILCIHYTSTYLNRIENGEIGLRIDCGMVIPKCVRLWVSMGSVCVRF